MNYLNYLYEQYQHLLYLRSLHRQLIAGVLAALIAGVAVLFFTWWLWWRLPKRQVDRLKLTIRDPKARADVEDNLRKTIGQLLGGAAVLIGAALAYLQFTQQQRTSHDLPISNQVSKGFEQLGSDKLVVRLGSIYALEGVMNTSEQYHQPVLEALGAFVRHNTRSETGEGPPATDIQAALTVIGRRKEMRGERVDLANVRIPKANLSGVDLDYADLSGAILRGANLMFAHLAEANLSAANLAGANLALADLSDANLWDAYLIGAAVSQKQLDKACGSPVTLDPGLTLDRDC